MADEKIPLAPAAQHDADDLVHAELVRKYQAALAEIEDLKGQIAALNVRLERAGES